MGGSEGDWWAGINLGRPICPPPPRSIIKYSLWPGLQRLPCKALHSACHRPYVIRVPSPPQLLEAPNREEITHVQVGHDHTVLIAGSDLYVTGSNEFGQLGLPGAARATPQRRPAPNGAPVEYVAAGPTGTAFLAGRQCFVMGWNANGQLGLPRSVSPTVPTPLDSPNGHAITSLALGWFHSAFTAITTVTPTVTPTITATHTPTGTAPPTTSLTPSRTVTVSTTSSASASGTPTPSHVLTPAPTVTRSATPTHSGTGSPSGTPTHTRTASRTRTATATTSPTLTRSPTVSAVHTRSPSCSTTPTGPASQTSTPTPTHTPSATRSPRATPTPSASASATVLPTASATPSSTLPFDECEPGDSTSDGWLGLQGGSDQMCARTLSLGSGSSMLREISVAIRIVHLAGGLAVRLDSGCPAQEADCPFCDACIRRYSAADVGSADWIAASASTLRVAVLHTPLVTALRRREPPDVGAHASVPQTDSRFAVEVVAVHKASPVALGLLALGAALIGLTCCCCTRRHARRMARAELPDGYWDRRACSRLRLHPRWSNPWIEVGLVMGLTLVLLGGLWYCIVGRVHDPRHPALSMALLGIVLAALGGALLVACAAFAVRDAEAYRCPMCHRPVSRWYFSGTYLPARGPGLWSKGHTDCLRCLECGKPVVRGAWSHASPQRPYHSVCWEATCGRLCAHATEVESWCRARDPTDAEAAYLLQSTIQRDSPGAMAALLDARPRIDSYPLPSAPSARHCAAEAAQLEALRALMARHTDELDVPPGAGAPADTHCLLITGMGPDKNDLYLPQPPLRYNDQPVYVGHSHGLYVYYYRPEAAAKPPGRAAGWCLSNFLGSGEPDFRLDLAFGAGAALGFEIPGPQGTDSASASGSEGPEEARRERGPSRGKFGWFRRVVGRRLRTRGKRGDALIDLPLSVASERYEDGPECPRASRAQNQELSREVFGDRPQGYQGAGRAVRIRVYFVYTSRIPPPLRKRRLVQARSGR